MDAFELEYDFVHVRVFSRISEAWKFAVLNSGTFSMNTD